MSGIGLILAFVGYCAVYWATKKITGQDTDSFASYLFPFLVKPKAEPKPTGVFGPRGKPTK